MPLTLYILLMLLGIAHFLILHYFGIAGFTTTLLLYTGVYYISKFLTRVVLPVNRQSYTAIVLRNLLLLLVLVEFLFAFIFRFTCTYSEKRYFVYISEYKRETLRQFLNTTGIKEVKDTKRYGYIPNAATTHYSAEFTFPTTFNNLGLRGPEPPVIPDSSGFNIIVLGDSFAEGFGAPEDSTFPVLLEAELRQLTGKPISVLNAGICGSSPLHSVSLYNNKLRSYRTDLVLMVSNLPDIFDIEYTRNASRMPLSEYGIASSHIFRLIHWGVLRNDMSSRNASRKSARIRQQNIQAVCDSLVAFKKTLGPGHTAFSLVYLPVSSEILPIPGNIPTKELLESYRQLPINLIDLSPPFRAHIRTREALSQYYWMIDGHLNSRGYMLMARLTAQAIVKQHLLERKPPE